MKRLRTLLLATPVLALAGAAHAGSVSGNYLLTLVTTHPQADTEQYCLSLSDDGNVVGWPHSGEASIAGFIGGEFYVGAGATVVHLDFHRVTFDFSLPVNAGKMEPAPFTAIYDGAIVSSGTVSAARKGSCTPA